jgi:hypothetical protein
MKGRIAASSNCNEDEALIVLAGPFRPSSSYKEHDKSQQSINNKNNNNRPKQGDRRGQLGYNPWAEKSLTKLGQKRQSTLRHLDEIQHVKSKSKQQTKSTGVWFDRVTRALCPRRRSKQNSAN